VADAIKKKCGDAAFIIPVRIDDTAFSDFPIQVHQLNAIDFSKGWGAKLPELLDTLEADDVPKFPNEQAQNFEKWRASYVRSSSVVENSPEPVLTNLLPVLGMPQWINFFEHNEEVSRVNSLLREKKIPAAQSFRLIVSFLDLPSLAALSPESGGLRVRARISFEKFLAGGSAEVTAPQRSEARKIATFLFRQHIENYLESRGLKRFESSSAPSFYFPAGLVENNKVPYISASGRKTNKNVVGRSERNKVHWHLAMKVNVSLGPPALVRFKPYVCFSEDGLNAINDPKKTSPIRKRFCKNWWNEHWRQLQVAFCVFLSGEADRLEIDLSGEGKLIVSGKLLELVAARKMPDDFKFSDDVIEPDEPEDIEDDDDASEPDEIEGGL